jgi:3-methyladenine DNA glycosylase AlkC
MSNLKKNIFSKLYSSLIKSEQEDGSVQEIDVSMKTWKKDYNPLRHIVLWGWDDNDNPSFIIFYGEHESESTENNDDDYDDDYNSTSHILNDDVKYTSYVIFKGKDGHLPSFEAVKIIDDSGYYNRNNDDYPKMYYKKGTKKGWYWSADDNYLVKEFKKLEPEQQISFPYFIPQCHEQYVEKIKKHSIEFDGFRLAKTPNEILKLQGDLTKYYEIIRDILSHHNLYMRKKKLNELLAMNPPKEVYNILFNLGSTEVISGLFLELGKMNNLSLVEEAKNLVQSEINWAHENYTKGVKRCANIYINAVDQQLKADRTKWIRESLSNMDLNLISINGKEIPPDKILEGAAYRKYAGNGVLRDRYSEYDWEERKYIESEAPQHYNIGPYTNGTKLNLIDFKNTIQEAEVYGIADVIGKIAYYLDAPRLTYYFKGNDRTNQLNYFHRYLRRIIDSYGKNNPDKFIEAMKHLFTSYTPADYVCKFRGNFQFNKYIKHYLYYDFKEKPPVGWDNWRARHEWMSNDQLMKLQGRHEFMNEIWDNHLNVVAEIALGSQIDQVLKACYYILKDSPKANEFIENITYKQLINLALVSYEPLSKMYMDILKNKLEQLNSFDSELMLALIGSSDKKMHELAMEFFESTNGLFSPSDIADLLFLDNLEEWIELFKQNIFALDGSQYVQFISYIINNITTFSKIDENLSEDIRDMLTMTTDKVKESSKSEKLMLMSDLVQVLIYGQKMPEWLGTFVEEIIFSFSYEDSEALIKEMDIGAAAKSIPSRNKQIISVLESIKNGTVPNDAQIISILDCGTSKMIKMLFEIITNNSEELNSRFSTLLIMMESEVTVLNNLAEDVFDNMPKEKQKKLHGLIIDSPVIKAYSFGLKKLDMLYGDSIPEEFIIQMLEHTSTDVKTYISDKINKILHNLGAGNEELFMYYVKTLLLLPNKVSKSKDRVYEAIPQFVMKHRNRLEEIENILLDIGGSNIIKDSERALIALAKIRGEVMSLES